MTRSVTFQPSALVTASTTPPASYRALAAADMALVDEVIHQRLASKVALVHLVARLIKGGFHLLDCQFMTEHLRSFGAIEVPREAFKALLADAIDRPASLQRELGGEDPCAVVQANTRTS